MYHFGEKDKSLKQFVGGKVTGYQKNNDGVTRKLVLGTIDGSPKKDLPLQKKAMPTPVTFKSGTFKYGDIVLDDPTSWEYKARSSADEFKEIVDSVSLEDILTPKKAR